MAIGIISPHEVAFFITVLAFGASIIYFFVKGYKARRSFYVLQKSGLPMPPWNPILGHLLVLRPVVKLFPNNAQQIFAFGELSKYFPHSDSSYYLDLWPFCDPLLIISSPTLAIQASQMHDLPKPKLIHDFFHPFAGGENVFTMNGPELRRTKGIFAPGFNAGYLVTQLKHIVEEAKVYVEILKERARKSERFSLDEATLNFTMDVSGVVTLNRRLHSQRGKNPLASAMRNQVWWYCMDGGLNPLSNFNPIRPIVSWYNAAVMKKYISDELDKRFADHKYKKKFGRSLIDLVIDNHLTENPSAYFSAKMDPKFKSWAITQLRLFLFAGHDSSSSTIVYCYYLLSRHPIAMARIRAEHNQVFGADISRTSAILVENPHLINSLPYTQAVVKEALRLFPPASGIRRGTPGAILTDPNQNRYPTQNLTIWILHNSIQRHPKYWKDPDAFIPGRWLVGPKDPYYPVKGAWRPFEFGPRNCLGQTMAMLDIKVLLVMTVREFEIRDAYGELDFLHPSDELKTVAGERAYQVSAGAAHPEGGFPCRVYTRSR